MIRQIQIASSKRGVKYLSFLMNKWLSKRKFYWSTRSFLFFSLRLKELNTWHSSIFQYNRALPCLPGSNWNRNRRAALTWFKSLMKFQNIFSSMNICTKIWSREFSWKIYLWWRCFFSYYIVRITLLSLWWLLIISIFKLGSLQSKICLI